MNLTREVCRRYAPVLCAAVCLLAAAPSIARPAEQVQQPAVPRMTGRYHFLSPEDSISILQEGELLKGYIDVYPGEDESDALLSYAISIGSRKGNQVEFRTRTIHELYYRFSGTVSRGAGKKPSDPDYLRLTGELQTVTSNSVTGTQDVQKQAVIFKSIPRGEGPPD